MSLPINKFKPAILADQLQVGLWTGLSSHISVEALTRHYIACSFDAVGRDVGILAPGAQSLAAKFKTTA